jgi:hypothetical protein
MTDLRCPVCDAPFGNPGALATHQQRTKDAAHVAGRTQAPAPSEAAPASPPASSEAPSRIASLQAMLSEAASSEAGDATLESAPGDAKQDAMQGEATLLPPIPDPSEAPEAQILALAPPERVEPLLPLGDAKPAARPAPVVVVPLEPIFAGMATAALNGLVLNKPTDGELTLDMVRATGFPQAAEACLRLYFPDLPLDHPLAALIGSGASLAVLVVSLKGAKAKAPEAKPSDASPGDAPAEAPPPASPPAQGATTGDPYWDAILAKAGGVAA